MREAGPAAPPGKVIAELMFGFWRYLSTTAHHHPLWIPYLHNAFTPGTHRKAVDGPVDHLHRLRNRIAHHEPLLRRNTAVGVLVRYVGDLFRRSTSSVGNAGFPRQALLGQHGQCGRRSRRTTFTAHQRCLPHLGQLVLGITCLGKVPSLGMTMTALPVTTRMGAALSIANQQAELSCAR